MSLLRIAGTPSDTFESLWTLHRGGDCGGHVLLSPSGSVGPLEAPGTTPPESSCYLRRDYWLISVQTAAAMRDGNPDVPGGHVRQPEHSRIRGTRVGPSG